MSCQEIHGLLDGYVDGELDLVRTLEFEGHLKNCAGCRALHDQLQKLREAIQTRGLYFDAPDGFEKKIRARVRNTRGRETETKIRWPFAVGWRLSAVAASIAALVIASAIFVEMLRRPSPRELLAQEVVSSHIRSLMANHLTDVLSTDQHTVKPWFSGKLDFAPVVKNLASKGFPLIGGRLDYLNDQSVAALLYKRNQHTISLFLWPVSGPDSRPQTLTLKGYSLIHWTRSHMTYWAVSDLNARELSDFVRDQEE